MLDSNELKNNIKYAGYLILVLLAGLILIHLYLRPDLTYYSLSILVIVITIAIAINILARFSPRFREVVIERIAREYIRIAREGGRWGRYRDVANKIIFITVIAIMLSSLLPYEYQIYIAIPSAVVAFIAGVFLFLGIIFTAPKFYLKILIVVTIIAIISVLLIITYLNSIKP